MKGYVWFAGWIWLTGCGLPTPVLGRKEDCGERTQEKHHFSGLVKMPLKDEFVGSLWQSGVSELRGGEFPEGGSIVVT